MKTTEKRVKTDVFSEVDVGRANMIKQMAKDKNGVNAFGPVASKIAKELAVEFGWRWIDCTTPRGFEQGMLRK